MIICLRKGIHVYNRLNCSGSALLKETMIECLFLTKTRCKVSTGSVSNFFRRNMWNIYRRSARSLFSCGDSFLLSVCRCVFTSLP